MKTTVIYHNADFDGIFCREIAKKFLPDAELIGWNFGDPPVRPTANDAQVYILDLPCDKPLGLHAAEVWPGCSNLIWIDHHASSIASHPKDIPGYRIDGVAACRLAWQWFSIQQRHETTPCCGYHSPHTLPYCVMWNEFNKVVQCHNCGALALPEGVGGYHDRMVSEPLAVRLAGEYDIWDKRDPNAELFQHGLRSQELTEEIWRHLLGDGQDYKDDETVLDLLNAGEAIQYFRIKDNANVIRNNGFTIKWEGLTFLACNHGSFNSHLFTAGILPEHDALLGFAWRKDIWSVSLYHAPGKEHHDLSKIAVKYGGGGHKGACGFTCAVFPFDVL